MRASCCSVIYTLLRHPVRSPSSLNAACVARPVKKLFQVGVSFRAPYTDLLKESAKDGQDLLKGTVGVIWVELAGKYCVEVPKAARLRKEEAVDFAESRLFDNDSQARSTTARLRRRKEIQGRFQNVPRLGR